MPFSVLGQMRHLVDHSLLIRLLHLDDLAKATSPHVIIRPVLISHLGAEQEEALTPSTYLHVTTLLGASFLSTSPQQLVG